jgi:cardiolipin synthase
MRALTAFLAVQAVVATEVTVRGRRVRAVREREAASSPYPSITFLPTAIEGTRDELTLFMTGGETIDAIVEAIDTATHEVCVETFIWSDDAIGRRVRDALVRACARGARVRVMYDGLGSLGIARQPSFFPDPIESFAVKPVTPWTQAARPRNLIRDHRKLVVVDDRVAFIGGYNFGAPFGTWRDTHAKVCGPSVHELRNAFVDFWNMMCPVGSAPMEDRLARDWDPRLLVHRNDPSLGIFPLRGMYLEAIDRATSRVWITNAYFVPDRSFRNMLTAAARRGVDVRIMLPRNSNHPMTDALANGMFDELLSSGVRIFLFRDHMVHAKTATIDGKWTTLGTANLDRWSMLGNYEVNIEVRSIALAEQMERMFELDLGNCRELDLYQWRRRPMHRQLGERTLKSLSPLM